jgi:hypothetical protein
VYICKYEVRLGEDYCCSQFSKRIPSSDSSGIGPGTPFRISGNRLPITYKDESKKDGQMIRWYDDQKIRLSGGQTIRWPDGQKVSSSTVRRSNGQTVRWSDGI